MKKSTLLICIIALLLYYCAKPDYNLDKYIGKYKGNMVASIYVTSINSERDTLNVYSDFFAEELYLDISEGYNNNEVIVSFNNTRDFNNIFPATLKGTIKDKDIILENFRYTIKVDYDKTQDINCNVTTTLVRSDEDNSFFIYTDIKSELDSLNNLSFGSINFTGYVYNEAYPIISNTEDFIGNYNGTIYTQIDESYVHFLGVNSNVTLPEKLTDELKKLDNSEFNYTIEQFTGDNIVIITINDINDDKIPKKLVGIVMGKKLIVNTVSTNIKIDKIATVKAITSPIGTIDYNSLTFNIMTSAIGTINNVPGELRVKMSSTANSNKID